MGSYDTIGHRTLSIHERERLADHIIADGWIRPPCKVGDRLYEIVEMNHTAHKIHNVFISEFPIKVEPYQIVYRNIMGSYSFIPFDKFGKTVFLSREEAEKALEERKENEQAKID